MFLLAIRVVVTQVCFSRRGGSGCCLSVLDAAQSPRGLLAVPRLLIALQSIGSIWLCSLHCLCSLYANMGASHPRLVADSQLFDRRRCLRLRLYRSMNVVTSCAGLYVKLLSSLLGPKMLHSEPDPNCSASRLPALVQNNPETAQLSRLHSPRLCQ